ncbi:MAG: phosphatase PAP2 family protein [Nitrososphaerales archaeon]|jgi:membrane-associated phospholipid phosphatase
MGETDAAEQNAKKDLFGLNSAILAAVLIYVTVVAAAYLRFGTLPVITLGAVAVLVLPFIGLATRSREFVKSSALVVAVLLTYEALQGITGIQARSGSVVSLAGVDQALVGSDFALDVQTAFASSATTFVSTVFYGLHVPLIIIAFVLFWFKDRAVYRGYTYSLVVTSYLALLTFVVLPTAPPWLAGTAQNLLKSGDKMLPSAFQELAAVLLSGESDVVAAFPSLHAAYATLFSIFMFKLGRKYGLTSLPIAGGVYFSIIYLGQHFLVDLLGGVAYAGISVYAVERVITRRRRSGSQSPSASNVTVSASTHWRTAGGCVLTFGFGSPRSIRSKELVIRADH